MAEGKPAEGTPAAAAPKLDADGKPIVETPPKTAEGAPEKYEAFTMPEGFEVDEQLLGEFAPVLKELNLPQAAAQKVIDFAPKLVERAVSTTLDAVGMADRAGWADTAKTDKEFGGDKLAENLAVARKAMDTFGTPELRAVLNKTGLGNHPEVIRAFFRAGKQISEDGFVPGGKTKTTPFYEKSNHSNQAA